MMLTAETECAQQRTEDPSADMQDFYRWHYTQLKFDSTPASRAHLLKRLYNTAANLTSSDVVLDLASGPQILEREYISGRGRPDFRFISVDFSKIEIEDLLAQDSSKVSHIQGRGEALPFPDGHIAVAICNMGLEYMEEKSIDELNRVLREGGIVHANLWTKRESWESYAPNTQTRDPGIAGYRIGRTPSSIRQMEFWQRFLSANVSPLLGQEQTEIIKILDGHNIHVTSLEEIVEINQISGEEETSWIAVDMVKVGK